MRKMCSLVLAMILMFDLISCAQSTAIQWKEQYDLGVRYLSEGNYEEAIIAFTTAIEIDPKCVETYESLANTYISAGEVDAALAILEKGYKITQDASLLAFLEEIQANMESAFINRLSYVAIDELSTSHQTDILGLIDAIVSQENETVWDLLQSDSSIANLVMNYSTYGAIYTEYDDFRLRLYIYSGNTAGVGVEMQAEVRDRVLLYKYRFDGYKRSRRL